MNVQRIQINNNNIISSYNNLVFDNWVIIAVLITRKAVGISLPMAL